MNSPLKLILWDIDGTLLYTGGAGEFALVEALEKQFGIRADLSHIELAGRTDKLIAMDILQGQSIPLTLENITRFTDGYLEALVHYLPLQSSKGGVLEGILVLLEEIHKRSDLVQGLLTGNLQRGARLKLEHYQIHHYFEFGAFADDHHDRNELPAHAKKRAEKAYAVPFLAKNIFIIGDTPHDIRCGKVIGAKTIAVATGKYSAQQLLQCDPTAVFETFKDSQRFFEVIDAK